MVIPTLAASLRSIMSLSLGLAGFGSHNRLCKMIVRWMVMMIRTIVLGI